MLYFVERKKNIIRRSGENIAAAEIENVLRSDKLVAYAAVIAVPELVAAGRGVRVCCSCAQCDSGW